MEKLLKKEWLEEIAARKEQVIAYRRHLHQHPELSFQEYETSQFIYDEMSKLANVEVTRPTATSVLVKITGAKPGKKIGLRADIDALPVQEQRDELDFRSTVDGKMHAWTRRPHRDFDGRHPVFGRTCRRIGWRGLQHFPACGRNPSRRRQRDGRHWPVR